MLTPKEAALQVGKSKATIIRHIKNGKLSADRDDSGAYHIDPSELARVYHVETGDPSHKVSRDTTRDSGETLKNSNDIAILQVKLDAANKALEDRDRELHHRDKTIDDLRSRLDTEGEERRKLTAMLTDQRPKGLWARLRGR